MQQENLNPPSAVNPTTLSDSQPPTSNEGDGIHLWRSHGLDDVAYQRQAQVTWWTVLGGLAVGALLTQAQSLTSEVITGRWHLTMFFLATCLIIINSWVQTVWGSLVLRWPITMPYSIIGFFSGLALCLAALNVTVPVLWCLAVVFVIAFAILTQLTLQKTDSQITLPHDQLIRARAVIMIYLIFEGIVIAGILGLWIFPSNFLEIIVGVVALGGSIFAVLWQHVGMTQEKKSLGIV